jgi:ATP-dependent Lhr-like helicase
VLKALEGGRALFFRVLSDAVGSLDDRALTAALWDLVWSAAVTNDTLAPLRALLAGPTRRRPAAPPPTRYARPGRAALPSRTGGPLVAGRWSLLPERDLQATRRAHLHAELLLDRYGVVTRGSVAAEDAPGGFAAAYRVLSAFEEAGRCRRAYAVEGLGAAQFAAPGAVDRLRHAPEPGGGPAGLVLAAADPANPYGAALPWPPAGDGGGGPPGHRPGRKAGASVVLVEGALVLYLERGGKTLLTFADDPAAWATAVAALGAAVRVGVLGSLAVERVDGASAQASPLAETLLAHGFRATPRALRLRR